MAKQYSNTKLNLYTLLKRFSPHSCVLWTICFLVVYIHLLLPQSFATCVCARLCVWCLHHRLSTVWNNCCRYFYSHTFIMRERKMCRGEMRQKATSEMWIKSESFIRFLFVYWRQSLRIKINGMFTHCTKKSMIKAKPLLKIYIRKFKPFPSLETKLNECNQF